MTGEITLRGEVLPIGGLKEKLLAAQRGGLKTVLIPKENEKELVEVPKNVKRGLEIVPVQWIDEILALSLESMPLAESIPGQDTVATEASKQTPVTDDQDDHARTH